MLRVDRFEQLIGRRPADLSPARQPDGRLSSEKAPELVRATLEQWSQPFEWDHVRADGEVFPAWVLTTAIRAGERGLLDVVWTDVSAEKRVERELAEQRRDLERRVAECTAELELARRAAEAASDAKSALLASMSHEIRAPMNAVLGLTHLALGTSLEARQRDWLTQIHGAGRHLLGVIDDILDFSKADAQKLELEGADFDVDTLLGEVATLLGDRADDKGLTLAIDVADDVPRRLVGDPLWLRPVLLNYGSNAVKFTERGSIRVAVRVVDRDVRGVTLRFEVRDTGVGLDDE